jgi:hypothetical protein
VNHVDSSAVMVTVFSLSRWSGCITPNVAESAATGVSAC